MTRAKFVCQSVSKSKHWNGSSENKFLYTAKLNPVTGNSDENKKFWEATPSGQIELTSILTDAFEPGKEYYVDFTPVEA